MKAQEHERMNRFRPRALSSDRKSAIRNRELAGIVVILLVLLLVGPRGEAQQAAKTPLLGYLDYGSATDKDAAFFEGLRDLGWSEGQSISTEYRWADGRLERLPGLAKELVNLKVDIIVARAATAIRSAKNATTTIPIVMLRAADAVESKLVVSLARPGGNVTGMSEDHADLHTKLLEILHETMPHAKRIAVLWNPTSQTYTRSFRAVQAIAPALGLTIQSLELNHYREAGLRPEKVDGVLEAAARERADALVVMPAMYLITGSRIAAFSSKKRLPVFSAENRAVERHFGLLAYTYSTHDMSRCAATYVEKVLKGVKPADLPVERPKNSTW